MKKLIKQTSTLGLHNSRTLTTSLVHSSTLSTLHLPTSLHPWFLTGFTDGEGCFSFNISRNDKLKSGWLVHPSFSISLHEKDRHLLERVAWFLGVGKIYKHGDQSFKYIVSSVKGLAIILEHFDRYPLITQKRADYELFKQIVVLMNRKEHRTLEGLQKIVNLRASMNNGLSDTLLAAFPKTEPVPRPEVVDQKIQDPNWLAGFVAGDGSFAIRIGKSTTHNTGVQVQLTFLITQHTRDAELLQSLVNYLACGKYYPGSGRAEGSFTVTRFLDITDKIIPFFEKYPVEGVKALDFADFRKASELIKAKAHLTSSGLEEIRVIKSGMNSGRNS